MKGLGGSNPPLSAKQSVFFVYILEKAENARELWRSFRRQRTGDSRPRPDSPDSTSKFRVTWDPRANRRRDFGGGGASRSKRGPALDASSKDGHRDGGHLRDGR
jgi:hypothetical protein